MGDSSLHKKLSILACIALFCSMAAKTSEAKTKKVTYYDESESLKKKKNPEIRIGSHETFTRLVVETPIDPNFTQVFNPSSNSITIQFTDGAWKYISLKEGSQANSPFESIEYEPDDKRGHGGKIVIFLKSNIKLLRNFSLNDTSQERYRYVLEFSNPQREDIQSITELISAVERSSESSSVPNLSEKDLSYLGDNYYIKASSFVPNEDLDKDNSEVSVVNVNKKTKVIKKDSGAAKAKKILKSKNKERPVIIIDAGHGGEDPGAINKSRKTKEKDITIKYALLLYAKLKQDGRYDVKLTRAGDYYVSLVDRREKARKYGGDLFISIHADSHPTPNARGLSVYTLSDSSFDDVAKHLMESNNGSDSLVNGVSFNNKDDVVSSVMINLSQRSSNNESSRFASMIIKNVKKRDIDLIYNSHRFAGFAVLKGPDIPSILVELGYVSNKEEEKMLQNSAYRLKLVGAIKESIDEFFKKRKR